MTLGAGFGPIATPLSIGVQSTVEWGQRGVVTGTNMFSRHLAKPLVRPSCSDLQLAPH